MSVVSVHSREALWVEFPKPMWCRRPLWVPPPAPQHLPCSLLPNSAFPRSEALKLWSGVLNMRGSGPGLSWWPWVGPAACLTSWLERFDIECCRLRWLEMKQELTGCLSASLVPSLLGIAEWSWPTKKPSGFSRWEGCLLLAMWFCNYVVNFVLRKGLTM